MLIWGKIESGIQSEGTLKKVKIVAHLMDIYYVSFVQTFDFVGLSYFPNSYLGPISQTVKKLMIKILHQNSFKGVGPHAKLWPDLIIMFHLRPTEIFRRLW